MSLFPCAACAAKDAELARVWQALRESQDRFSALTGTLSEVANARGVEAMPPVPETPSERELTDIEWANRELEEAAARAERKHGPIVPDFTA